MLKWILPAAFALALSSGGASAQSLEIGPGGVRIDPRTPGERARDRELRRDRRASERWRREGARDGVGRNCRTIYVREENDDGRVVRRRIRQCD